MPNSWVHRAGRLARTLVHLHPAQIAFRPVHVARTALLAHSPALARLVAGTPRPTLGAPILSLRGAIPSHLPGVAAELARAAEALEGRVELVGRKVRIDPPRTPFVAPEDPKLVRYQLNYLGTVRSLAVASRVEGVSEAGRARSLAVAHAREFVERVPPGTGDAWEPYVVAIRILNLVVSRELLRPVASEDEAAFLDGPLLVSLAQHARWLAATLELHLLGNHFFTDGAALYVAGCALETPGAPAWRTLGHAIIARSLAQDVLADGGHTERSPMYAAIYLDQLSLVLAAGRAAGVAIPAGALASAVAMARQLLDIAHPDGEIPLLGDAALGEAPPPADVAGPFGLSHDSLRRRLYGAMGAVQAPFVREDGVRSFADTGLARVRAGVHQLVVDAGPLGTSDQPGHAHADALSFELSHSRRRLVVDGGAGHYDADAARAYFRGPLAHSAVSVDGEGPDELWGAFRAGGRGLVEPLSTTSLGPLHALRGAVRASSGWRHERLLFYCPGRLLAVFDRVTGAGEDAQVQAHLHLAPDVGVKLDEPETALVEQDGERFVLRRLAGTGWKVHRGEATPMRGWSSKRMGRFEPSPEVAIDAATSGGASVAAYALILGDGVRIEGSGALVRLEVPGAAVKVGLDARGLRFEQL